jgi:hypothetical protein
MSNEEERKQKPEFRVVDKRISARGDSPPDPPAPAPSPSEEPSPPPATEPEPAPEPPAEASPGAAPGPGPAPGGEQVWTPEQEAEARAFVEEISQRPSVEWVVNAAATLANVAGTKIDLGQTADAQLAIDALAAIVEKLGPRLDQAEAPLRQVLAQLQLAYTQRATQPPPQSGGPPKI